MIITVRKETTMKNQNYAQVKYYLCYSTDSSEIRKYEDYAQAFTYAQWVGETTGRTITVEAVY